MNCPYNLNPVKYLRFISRKADWNSRWRLPIHLIGKRTFKGFSIVSCGTVRREIEQLKEEGFLDADRLFFTTPGLHELPKELENQLVRQVLKAKSLSGKVIVLYGDRCFVDSSDYYRGIDTVLAEQGDGIVRVRAHNCIDMLASGDEREAMADGREAYWLVPGWIEFRKYVFLEWDTGKANETFPANDLAILLDPLGYYERLAMENPEEILEFSDWMGISIEPRAISLDHLKGLLSDCAQELIN